MKAIRILFVLAAAAFLSLTIASAQVSVGAGYLYQGLSEKVKGSSSKKHTSFSGIYAGFDFGIRCGKVFSIVPGLYYEFMDGGRNLMRNVGAYDVRWREHYLKIPVDFRFGFNIGRAVRMFAGAGPKLHIGLASTIKGEIESFNFYDYAAEYNSSQNAYGRFDVLLGFNAGLEIFRHCRMQLGYDYGLINRTRNIDSSATHSSQFYIGAAYIF